MPHNGPPKDDDYDRDRDDPPVTSPYRPMGPQALPWREWLGWLFRGLTRGFVSVGSVGFAWLGRGLEVAAAGVLIAGVAITWHFGVPPFAGASDQSKSCEHHCCHGPATQQVSGEVAEDASNPPVLGGQIAGAGVPIVDRQLGPGEEGEFAATSTPCQPGSSTSP